jgi:hypothetical protein
MFLISVVRKKLATFALAIYSESSGLTAGKPPPRTQKCCFVLEYNSAAGATNFFRHPAHSNKKLRIVGDKFCLFKSCTTFYAVGAGP